MAALKAAVATEAGNVCACASAWAVNGFQVTQVAATFGTSKCVAYFSARPHTHTQTHMDTIEVAYLKQT